MPGSGVCDKLWIVTGSDILLISSVVMVALPLYVLIVVRTGSAHWSSTMVVMRTGGRAHNVSLPPAGITMSDERNMMTGSPG